MVVNLYVTVPAHHPGTHSASYFAGSLHNVAWAIAHGAATLAVHATLGLALIAFASAPRYTRCDQSDPRSWDGRSSPGCS